VRSSPSWYWLTLLPRAEKLSTRLSN
jgi:hypothetical protein